MFSMTYNDRVGGTGERNDTVTRATFVYGSDASFGVDQRNDGRPGLHGAARRAGKRQRSTQLLTGAAVDDLLPVIAAGRSRADRRRHPGTTAARRPGHAASADHRSRSTVAGVVVDGVDARREEAEQHHGGVESERRRGQNESLVGVDCGEVGRHERQPYDESRVDA